MPSPPPERVVSVDETAELVREALLEPVPDDRLRRRVICRHALADVPGRGVDGRARTVARVREITAGFEGMKYYPRSGRQRRKTYRVEGRGGSTELVTYEPISITLHRRPRT